MAVERVEALAGERLVFDPSGRFVMSLAEDRVSLLHEPANPTSRRIEIERSGVRAIAAFRDQVWLATERAIERFDLQAKPLGEPAELPEDFAAWHVAPCGAPGVIALGHPPTGYVDDLGTLVACKLPEADALVPFTARRVVSISGQRLQLPSGIATRLPLGTRLTGALVLADGKWLVLTAMREGRRELCVLSMGSGQWLTRLALAPGNVQIAARRAIALVQVASDAIAAVDLRTGLGVMWVGFVPGFASRVGMGFQSTTQAMAQMNPTRSRPMAVTATTGRLRLATRWR